MVFRRSRRTAQPDPIDPTAVSAAYRSPVVDALRARDQFDQLARTVQPGPLHDRLAQLRERVMAGVEAVWQTARRATELERVVASLDPDRVTADLKHARRADANPEVLEALNARFASVQRLMNSLDALRDRLPILEARLATTVARTAELAFASSSAGVESLERDLGSVVIELEALARATAELG